MLQIALILVAIIAISMGSNAIKKGELQLSRSKTITGPTAKTIGRILIALGVIFILLATVGLAVVSLLSKG